MLADQNTISQSESKRSKYKKLFNRLSCKLEIKNQTNKKNNKLFFEISENRSNQIIFNHKDATWTKYLSSHQNHGVLKQQKIEGDLGGRSSMAGGDH